MMSSLGRALAAGALVVLMTAPARAHHGLLGPSTLSPMLAVIVAAVLGLAAGVAVVVIVVLITKKTPRAE